MPSKTKKRNFCVYQIAANIDNVITTLPAKDISDCLWCPDGACEIQ